MIVTPYEMGLRVFLNFINNTRFHVISSAVEILMLQYIGAFFIIKSATENNKLKQLKKTARRYQYPPKQALNNIEMLNFFGTTKRMGIESK